ncbi:MAG: long-chain fatty acid--CoA ligase, partial [Spirochaetales bacterium]|nr:long-chain fatty acid--CoA ligase [Spirochaetales bacterium]
VGQDKKFLAALIVPNMELLEEFAKEKGISYIPPEDLLEDPEIQEYIHDEIQSQVSTKTGFKPFECVFRFKLLEKPFEVGKELTQTLKLRRSVIDKLFAKEIKALFK